MRGKKITWKDGFQALWCISALEFKRIEACFRVGTRSPFLAVCMPRECIFRHSGHAGWSEG